mgnify:CR=1 FL=1
MEKYLYTIGETAEILGEATSCVRFWSDNFPKFIHPKRNAKGNRLFTKEDIETFKHIQMLLKRLKGDRKDVINKAKVLDTLKDIRQQLVEIRSEL